MDISVKIVIAAPDGVVHEHEIAARNPPLIDTAYRLPGNGTNGSFVSSFGITSFTTRIQVDPP
jgi:hypothetical protein